MYIRSGVEMILSLIVVVGSGLSLIGLVAFFVAVWKMMRAHQSVANTLEVLAQSIMERLQEKGSWLPEQGGASASD